MPDNSLKISLQVIVPGNRSLVPELVINLLCSSKTSREDLIYDSVFCPARHAEGLLTAGDKWTIVHRLDITRLT